MGYSSCMIVLIIVCYLIGSIPFAVIIAKIAGIGDITKMGSGNPGATNMLRVAGKKLGAINFLLDFAKGFLAVKFGEHFGYENAALLAVVVGHCFSVFLHGRGGKGVATTLGGLLGLNPLTGFLAIGVWLTVFVAFRISSLSALVTMSATIIASMVYWYDDFFWAVFVVGALVIYRHKANIQRLLSGSEK